MDSLCVNCFEEKGTLDECPFCGYNENLSYKPGQHLPPRTFLHGKYLIGTVLGQGGFGITYLAFDTTLNLKLAIKEYLPHQIASRTSGSAAVTVFQKTLSEEFKYGLKKFLEEARTLARFADNTNFVSVRDYFEDNDTAYMVMNYVQGTTLQSYLDNKGGIISVEEALSLFIPVFDALKEIHADGILHRDISPDNLLINSKGQVVLIDFGAARQAMNQYSKGLSVILKAGYSPEEQYRSKGQQGPWTDIYALAATFYRTITGWMPPESLDRLAEDKLIMPSDLGVEINPYQEQVFMKALSVKAADRYQTVQEFEDALYGEPSDMNIFTTAFAGETLQTGEAETVAAPPYDAFPRAGTTAPVKEKPAAAARPAVSSRKGTSNTGKIAVGFLSLIVVASLLLFLMQSNNMVSDLPSRAVKTDLAAPKLVFPGDRVNITSREVVFRWNRVEGAEYYWLTIVKMPQNTVFFDGQVGNVTEVARRGFPADGSEYRWRIAAGNTDGIGQWSDYATFLNGTAQPSATAAPATTTRSTGGTTTAAASPTTSGTATTTTATVATTTGETTGTWWEEPF